MKKLLTVSAILLLVLVYAGNISAKPKKETTQPIIGAFGIKLGQIFNPANNPENRVLDSGAILYHFTPKKRFRSFHKYYVLITPETHRVYCIWAIGKIKNGDAGRSEQAVIIALLEKKYGVQAETPPFSLFDTKWIDQGNRTITVRVKSFWVKSIEIRYFDLDLQRQAEKERISIELDKIGKVEDSGL